VTDAGLVHLNGLTQLAKLDLSNTLVTDEGVAEREDRSMSTAPSIIPKPKRRGLQFSPLTLTLMVLVVIVSVPLGWFAYQLKQARDRGERQWQFSN
jgi:hypothetical protein